MDSSTDIERAVERGTRRAVKRYRNQALAGFMILLAGLAIGVGLREHDQHDADKARAEARLAQLKATRAVATTNCNITYTTVTNTRSLLISLDTRNLQMYRTGLITKVQRDKAHNAYLALENKLVLPDCRRVVDLLSNDPKRPIPVVMPRYFGDGLD